MKLQYLGTAAAEGFPGLFCTCENCERARRAGGRNIRSRSQAVLDDRLLIDFPADTYYHALRFGLQLEKIHHCLITHAHSDHLYPEDFLMREPGYAVTDGSEPLYVYGTAPTVKAVQKVMDFPLLEGNGSLRAVTVKPYEPFCVAGYTVTALPADHAPELEAVIYVISRDGKTMLYAHDSGMLAPEVTDWLRCSGLHFDFVSVDCCGGLLKNWQHGHLGLDTDREFMAVLQEAGVADSRTRVCVNHFSHNGIADYDELVPEAARIGFDVSYDGKTVEF